MKTLTADNNVLNLVMFRAEAAGNAQEGPAETAVAAEGHPERPEEAPETLRAISELRFW
jgi:hypothetical protein